MNRNARSINNYAVPCSEWDPGYIDIVPEGTSLLHPGGNTELGPKDAGQARGVRSLAGRVSGMDREAGDWKETRVSAVIHSDQICVPRLRQWITLLLPLGFFPGLNPSSVLGWKVLAETGRDSTHWVTRVQSPPCAPLGKTAHALLMIPVNSPHNFPYRVCCFVRNQNCTSTGERFRRLSENVKKKASGREVIAPLLIFVNMIFATINGTQCPIRTMVMTHF